LTDGTLIAEDETELYVSWLSPQGPPRGALVMVHGFSSHSGLYQETARFFAEKGLAVCAYDSRGHGRSSGRRGHVRRFSNYRDDLALVVSEVNARYRGLPLFLLGHSQGGTVVLDYALERQAEVPRLAGLILLCPFLGLRLAIPAYKRALSPILNWLWPTLTLGNELEAEDAARTPEVQRILAADPLVHHVATARWFSEIRATQAAVIARAADLRTPTWLGVAGGDRIVRNDSIRAFAAAVVAPLTCEVYEGAAHELLLDPEKSRVCADIANWVVGRLLSPYNSVHS
jgi:alpha-beta hydrolase superfamily lysophospholipase